MRYKPTNFEILSDEILTLKTETGHIVKFKLKPDLSTDIDSEDEGNPFFYLSLTPEYVGVQDDSNSLTLDEVKDKLNNRNLITDKMEYDHIQIGFIYSDDDKNNHRWMLNFMDVNNTILFNFIGDNIKVNCAFTTMSWEDGTWHGRIVVYKKDVVELLELSKGEYTLTGISDISGHNLTPIDKSIDMISLRYNTTYDIWTCDLKSKGKKVGEYPAKILICDVPFIGAVDKSVTTPKVTAELNIKDIAGISMTMAGLIIKKK